MYGLCRYVTFLRKNRRRSNSNALLRFSLFSSSLSSSPGLLGGLRGQHGVLVLSGSFSPMIRDGDRVI